MKIKLLLFSLVVGFVATTKAQVRDVSVFVEPTAGYNWFDSKNTVKDAVMYGVRGGFGFGRGIELRGVFEQSSNLKQDFSHFNSKLGDLGLDFDLPARDVKVRRIGGEFKANIPAEGLAPYFLVGTGVQTFKRELTSDETLKTENIYGTAGLGLKFNLTKRLTFNIEGRAFGYNMTSDNMLMDPEEAAKDDDFADYVNGQKRNTLFDFSVNAGLQLYLGGTNEDNLSSMDKAYRQRFGSGLSRFKVSIAPLGSYVDFDSESGYRDTYMLGAELGVEFTDFVGLKAYYLRSTEDEEISLDFDKLSMYGLDFVGRLNVARGIVPYITVGGGYIDVHSGYKGDEEINTDPSSKFYAKGGLGLEIPLGRSVSLFGSANLMYTTDRDNSDIDKITNTDELKSHTMYDAGVRIKIGKKAKTSDAVDREFDSRFDSERQAYSDTISDYNKQVARYDERVDDYEEKLAERDKRVEEYETRIDQLEEDLQKAFKSNDEERVSEIMKEKKYLEGEMVKENENAPENPLIRMTPSELESLIDKVLRDVEEEDEKDNVEKRLERMEKLLLQMNSSGQTFKKEDGSVSPANFDNSVSAAKFDSSASSDGSANDRLLEEISKLQKKVDNQDNTIESLRTNSNRGGSGSSDNENAIAKAIEASNDDTGTKSGSSGYNLSKGFGLYVGPNFGDGTSFNIGGRWYHAFTNSSIMIMPEAYIAIGGDFGFGINANAVLPIQLDSDFTPYAGVGVGVNYLGKEFRFNPNVIVGASYQLGQTNSVFIDYTVRGAFKNNQIALGYRFSF